MNASSGSGLCPTRIVFMDVTLAAKGRDDERMIASLRQERDVAVQAAKAAGRVLLDWQGRFSIRRKGANDVVTEADQAAQDAIFKAIERRFPKDGFVGEEGGNVRTDAKRRWIVDPLDGTSNYVHGMPFFCVSIALEVDGQPVVGVVYDPVRNECFAASAGEGADCNGVPIHASTIAVLDDALICGGMPADVRANQESTRAFVSLAQRTYAVRRLGSAALAL